MLDKLIDLGYEFLDTFECAPSKGALSDDIEPDFHLVEPRSRCRCIVNVVARTRRQPPFDLGVLVGRVVVHYEMDIQFGRRIGIHTLKEAKIFLMFGVIIQN
jgi:hypothetical protein